jgi:hypothetical protein
MGIALSKEERREKVPFTAEQLSEMDDYGYSSVQIRYIAKHLGRDDLIPINETEGMGVGDYLAVAVMEDLRARKPSAVGRLRKLVPRNMLHYVRSQNNWIMYEGKMCALKERRKIDMGNREDAQHVLHVFNDEHHNNDRFNLFYRVRNRRMCFYRSEEEGEAKE